LGKASRHLARLLVGSWVDSSSFACLFFIDYRTTSSAEKTEASARARRHEAEFKKIEDKIDAEKKEYERRIARTSDDFYGQQRRHDVLLRAAEYRSNEENKLMRTVFVSTVRDMQQRCNAQKASLDRRLEKRAVALPPKPPGILGNWKPNI
jgi:hypothetical protein